MAVAPGVLPLSVTKPLGGLESIGHLGTTGVLGGRVIIVIHVILSLQTGSGINKYCPVTVVKQFLPFLHSGVLPDHCPKNRQMREILPSTKYPGIQL